MSQAVTPVNQPNKTQYFYPSDDKWEMTNLPMKASTAMTEGAALGIEISANDVTGYITLMGTTNANGHDFVGILAEPILSTDGDYATAGKLKQVRVPRTIKARAYFAVGAGTFTSVDLFKTVAFNSNSLGLDVDTKGLGARIVKYINATQGVCEFDMPTSLTS